MPIYEYEHENEGCALGKRFELRQSINDPPLDVCPECGAPVKKLISRTHMRTPAGDAKLKDTGFTKLVRRDKGVYENVTPRKGEKSLLDFNKDGS